jgi:hypothetical protein
VRAGHLLAVNFGAACAAKLLKLRIERLPVGADAGVAETAVLIGPLSGSFDGAN